MEDGYMLDALRRIEDRLPLLITAPIVWNTLDVDYEPPRVERLWHQFDPEFRVYLHRIHPCEKALYHPHPWPSAVKILSGRYEMALGYREQQHIPGKRPTTPPYASLQRLTEGSSYEMIRPCGWHYVRPLGGVSYSIMVTGPKWEGVWSPKADHKLNSLSDETKSELLSEFSRFYRL